MTEVSTRSADPAPPTTNGHGPSDELPKPPAVYDAGGGRRWPALLLGVAVGVGGTVGAVTLLDRQADEADETAAATVELATAEVEQRDLIEEIEWTGTLGYAEPVAVTGSGGTVTATATVGATLDRGDVILAVDNEPVVAMFGSTPMWRSLSDGDTGIDVFQLEANLAALGHDPDQTVDIDDTFTANTAAMVERWQTEIGAEITGAVALGAVVILDGPSVVSEAPEIGASGAGQLVTVAPRATVADVVASVDGVITSPAAIGTLVEHGTVLYAIDEVAVPAVIDADPVADTLGEDSFTLLELEQALADGGFDPESQMTVDGVVTDATRAAIERWQADAGLPVTGQSDPGYYWIVPEGLTVESQAVDDGQTIVAGGPVLTLSASQLAVEVSVDVADADEFTEGQEVTVELADETTAPGVVVVVGPVVQSADPQSSPTVTIEIVVDAEGTEPVAGPVTVLSAGEIIEGATVVPTRALISLSEGGFAVEKVGPGGATELVGIEIGTFDDGVVEVVDGDLSAGDDVVVPR